MNIIYLLLPLALILGSSFALAFIASTRSGQFDDLETPAHLILIEDDLTVSLENNSISENKKGKMKRTRTKTRL